MHLRPTIIIIISFNFILLSSCERFHNRSHVIAAKQSVLDTAQQFVSLAKDTAQNQPIDTLNHLISRGSLLADTLLPQQAQIEVTPEALAAFAISLEGSPYKYASQDPNSGFDNSGFVNYVFKKFSVEVPRNTAAFATVGKSISLNQAGPGDILLLSISDVKDTGKVGHVGIIVSEIGQPLSFIHATSGKFKGVVITNFNTYYQKRFIGIRSLFK